MEQRTRPAESIRTLLTEQQRSYAWLAREAGVGYKETLSQVKHERTELTFLNAIRFARALGVDVPDLVKKVA